MIALLKDLADVLEKHKGGLVYTTDDDGIHVTINDDWKRKVCIEWPANGDVAHIRRFIENNRGEPRSPEQK